MQVSGVSVGGQSSRVSNWGHAGCKIRKESRTE